MINIKKIKPMFTTIVTTMDKYEEYSITKGGIIDGSKAVGSLKEYQTVIAVGSTVRDIAVGDVVWVNPKRFAKPKHTPGSLKDGVITDNVTESYTFDVIKLDGKDCLLLQDRDIEFVVEEYDETEEAPPSQLIHPQKSSIMLT